jgi:hypothetical protein
MHALRDEMRAGFDASNRRTERVEGTLAGVEKKLEGVEGRLGRVEHEVVLLKDAVLEHGRELKKHGRQLEELRSAVDKKVDRAEVEGIVQRAVGGSGTH